MLFAFLLFVAAVGTLVGTQVADLLSQSDSYITDTVDFINDTFGTEIDAADVIDEFNDPERRACSSSSRRRATRPSSCR